MSPRDRERAYEKRRYERRMSVLEQKEAARQRNQQVMGVVAAVVLVVGGFILLATLLGRDTTTPSASPTTSAPSATATATATTSPTSSGTTTAAPAATVAGCTAPHAPPTDKRTRTKPNASLAGAKTWVATLKTNCGDIVLELDGSKAPQTVASFINLATTGYWNDSPCHRLTVANDGLYVLQCGDPTGTGSGNPGYGFGVENAPSDYRYPAGTLAMARTSDPNSNGGQFFIVYKDTELQDATGYSIFGTVTKGLDLVNKIAATGVSTSKAPAPNQPISILSVTVAEKK